MLKFKIVPVDHPFYPEITYTALRWETPGAISMLNVDCPLEEVEKTLMTYMGTKEIDNLEYLIALKMVRDWKKAHADVPWPNKKIKEYIHREKKWTTETA